MCPGIEENIAGKPFVGMAGQLLDEWIAHLDLEKEDYSVTNVAFVLPVDDSGQIRDPNKEEIKFFSPYLKELIEILNPEIMVLLGKVSTEAMGFEFKNGEFLDNNTYCIYHPAFYLRKNRKGLPDLEGLKERLLPKEFKFNFEKASALGRHEMVGPVISATHAFCKLNNVEFLDINQESICKIGGKKTKLLKMKNADELYFFNEYLESDIEYFIVYSVERGEISFLGFTYKDFLNAKETVTHYKTGKSCKTLKITDLTGMHSLWRKTFVEKQSIPTKQEQYFPLHFHSEFSIQDAFGDVKTIAEALYKKGFSGAAITDHGTLAGTIYFQRALREKGLKPVLGIEAYIVEDYDDKELIRHHITLLVKNETGWKNLLKLHAESVKKGFYYKPRILLSSLLALGDGIVVLSGCMNGLLSYYINKDNPEKALEYAKTLKERFKDDFYIEIMPHYEIEETKKINDGLLNISSQLNVKMVYTGDSHYQDKEDKKVHNLIKAVNYRKKYGEADYTGNTYYYMSAEEIKKIFSEHFGKFDVDELFKNTFEVAEKCNFEIKPIEGETLPSDYDDPDEELKKDVMVKLNGYGKEYYERAKLELQRYTEKGYSNYMLIVRDLLKWCRKNNIMHGPGRGSSGGSLVAKLIGITEPDPIKFGLLIDRFCSAIRKDSLDIDLDFEDEKRSQVISYLQEKYGKDNTAKIITYSKWHGKGAIRDAGRVFSIPIKDVERVAKLVVMRSGGDMRTNFCLMDTFTEFSNAKSFQKKYSEPSELAIKIEGKIRHRGIHAAGLIIANRPIDEMIPIAKVNGEICTEWEKNVLDDLGLIKFDILGLKTLSVISDTISMVGNKIGLPKEYEDKKIYDTVFKNGNCLGIFQLETSGLSKMSKQLPIDNFKLLYQTSGLYRPSSLHSGECASFILKHQGKEEVKYVHPILEPLTKDSYAVIIWQEQVMKIMHELGGFSWSTAESARKIMTKSKGKEVFNKLRKEFVENAYKYKNLPKEEGEKIFDAVSTFGSYGFCLAHAVEYSIISYWTAFLKTYHTKEFFTALLKRESEDSQEANYINNAKEMGIKVNIPNINYSKESYTIYKENIYAGFSNIKGLGPRNAQKIVKNQPYADIKDLMKRLKPSISVFKAMILSGCFDDMLSNRKVLYDNAEKIKKNINLIKLLDENALDWNEKEKSLKQSTVISVYSGKHLIEYSNDPFKDKIKYEKIGELNFDEYIQERYIKGIISFVNFKTEGTEGKWSMFENVLERRYAHLNVNDGTGNVLVHLSPEQYTYYKHILERVEGVPVIIKGHSIPNYNKIYCDAMIVLDNIDYKNPIIKYFDGQRQKEFQTINFNGNKGGVIKTCTYKVSKRKNPYARINLVGEKDDILCFKLDKDIFVAGEIIEYKQDKPPFADIVRRIK